MKINQLHTYLEGVGTSLLASKSYPGVTTGAAGWEIATSVSAEIRVCQAGLVF